MVQTFAPCAQLTSARAVLFDACQNRKRCYSWDVKTAFLNAVPDYTTFVHCPPGRQRQYAPDGTPLVYEFVYNCYGNPSAPRRWHCAIHNALVRRGFKQSYTEPSLYTMVVNGVLLSTLLYTGDCMCTFDDTPAGVAAYTEFIDYIKSNFELQDDGHQVCTDFIGMNISWGPDNSWVRIDQPKFINNMLGEHGFAECRTQKTPAIPGVLLSTLDSPADDESGDADRSAMKGLPLRARVGSQLWLARTSRPDLSHSVGALTRVVSKPGKAHWDASSYLMRYVAGTKSLGLTFHRDDSVLPGQFKPTGYTDSDYAPDWGDKYMNYNSTTGWVFTLNGTAVSWRSRRQDRCAQSSSEAEWYAAADAAKEAEHLRLLMLDLGNPIHGPIYLNADNQSAIKCSENTTNQEQQKHISVRSHFLRQQVRRGVLKLQWVPGADNWSDQFTKPVPAPLLKRCRAGYGLMESVDTVG